MACALKIGILDETYSVHARILPFLEQGNLYSQINYSLNWSIQTTVAETKVSGFLCPSDPKSGPYPSGPIRHCATSYGALGGTWLMWDPNVNKVGDGMFLVNKCIRPAEISDGLGNTVAISEVKVQSPVLRDGGNPNTPDVPPPTDPS